MRVDANAGAERTDRTRFLAAVASLELAEPVRQRFAVVKLTQPLANSLKLKKSLMEEVINAYTIRSSLRRCRGHNGGNLPPR